MRKIILLLIINNNIRGLIKKCISDGKECYCREIFKKVMVKDVIVVVNMKKW